MLQNSIEGTHPVQENKTFSNFQTIRFIFILCFICALILSILSISLKKPQEEAKELYRSQQLLIAAKILNYKGYFQVPINEEHYHLAAFDETTQSLVQSDQPSKPSRKAILTIFTKRIKPMLVNSKGDSYTFEDAGIDYNEYLAKHQKYGFANLPNKLIYFVYDQNDQLSGFVIPINGYGLWDAIYGYLGLEKNGNTILATTWYDQKETPGLGGNIALPSWQKQFEDKQIFQETNQGAINLERATIGITVVKTTVAEELSNSPKAKSAVDGIAGATVTSNGVTSAYKNSLAPYRTFLIKQYKKQK